MAIFLWCQMASMIFVRKSIHVHKHLRSDHVQSNNYGMFHLVWIYHGSRGRTSSCTSSAGWPWNVPCLPAFQHIDVREVVLSWWRSRELRKNPSYTWWSSYFLLCLYARSARTCSRRCQRPSMINIPCTSFWVPSRAIHTVQCFQHPESFVLIQDGKG